MELNENQLTCFQENGFLFCQNVFDPIELNIFSLALEKSIEDKKSSKKLLEGVVFEKNDAVRTLNGLHLDYEVFQNLYRHPRILLPAKKLLNNQDIYMHQFKINLKKAFDGDIWEWHQDYIYWLKGDAMPEPKAITVAIFLDDVTEFNSPIMFIPGSHQLGTLMVSEKANIDNEMSDWISDVSAKLKYTIPRETIIKLVADKGIVAPKGVKGSILFFDCNVIHSSSNNLSPFDRRIAYITYNPITNIPNTIVNPRPEFLASRDYAPLLPL